MQEKTDQSIRYHGLDALRGLAMFLGVVLHGSMFYVEGIGATLGYAFSGKIPPVSPTLGMVFIFIHIWRMPVFFLLAGFFTRLMIGKRDIASLLKNRFIRIIIPLIIGMMIYNIIFRFGEGGPGEEFSILKLHHLWFLYDLIWMYLLIVSILYLAQIRFLGRVITKITRFIDRSIFGSPMKMLLLLIPMIPIGVSTKVLGLFNNITTEALTLPNPFFVFGFLFFLIGWFIHRNLQLLTSLSKHWIVFVILGIVFFIIMVFSFALSWQLGETKPDSLPLFLSWIGYILTSPITILFIILGFIGFAEQFFQKPNLLLRYLVEASYWVYILHLVVVFVIGGIIIKETNLSPILGALLNIFITTLFCIITYHIFVRYTPIGWVLNGRMHKPFWITKKSS